ncbi:hypothetical protein SLA2020_369720 [Shorea laevis]
MSPRRNSATGANTVELGDHEDITHPETVEIRYKELSTPILLNCWPQLVTAIAQDREARLPVGGQGCTLKIYVATASIISMDQAITSALRIG